MKQEETENMHTFDEGGIIRFKIFWTFDERVACRG